jgi:serine/threonine-protein kinase
VQALYANEAEFLRTPKTSEEAHFRDAIRANRAETFFGLLGLAGIAASLTQPVSLAGPLTAALLLWPTIAYLSAPFNSLAAQRAALPPELRYRRSTEFLRTGNARRVTAAGGLALAGVAAAAVLTLTAPGNVHVNGPNIIGPVRGQPAKSSTASPSESPSTSGSATTTSSPSASDTPSSEPSPSATSTSPSSAPTASGAASASPTG